MARSNPSTLTNSHSASQENLRMQRKMWVVFVIAGVCHRPVRSEVRSVHFLTFDLIKNYFITVIPFMFRLTK